MMPAVSVRKVFWLLLFLEAVLLISLENAGIKLLRVTEFGASGSSKMWLACIGILELGLASTYLATIVISIKSKKLLLIEPFWKRLRNLCLTIAWPGMVFVMYGVLVGYPAS